MPEFREEKMEDQMDAAAVDMDRREKWEPGQGAWKEKNHLTPWKGGARLLRCSQSSLKRTGREISAQTPIAGEITESVVGILGVVTS